MTVGQTRKGDISRQIGLTGGTLGRFPIAATRQLQSSRLSECAQSQNGSINWSEGGGGVTGATGSILPVGTEW